MKRTPLYEKHVKAGAKIVPFAGYEMPVQYSGAIKEHMAVRENIGLFDVSHMGQFFVKGPHAMNLLNTLTTNDVSKIKIGQAQYNCMTNHEGGIVDDLIIYRLADNDYMMVVNAANIDKDWDWLMQHKDQSTEIRNESDKMALLAIQGPKAIEAMQSLTDFNLSSLPFYHFTQAPFAGVENVIISSTGYTGSGGLEIYVPAQYASAIWDKVVEAGTPYQIELCGLAARDTLRLEKGYCLYGNDIDDSTTPLQAGLGWITKLDKDFTAAHILKKEKIDGSVKKLIAFKMIETAVPRSGYEIVAKNGQTIGHVTSGTMSPILKTGIGMGYVDAAYLKTGQPIYIKIRSKEKEAKIVKLPFV